MLNSITLKLPFAKGCANVVKPWEPQRAPASLPGPMPQCEHIPRDTEDWKVGTGFSPQPQEKN